MVRVNGLVTDMFSNQVVF